MTGDHSFFIALELSFRFVFTLPLLGSLALEKIKLIVDSGTKGTEPASQTQITFLTIRCFHSQDNDIARANLFLYRSDLEDQFLVNDHSLDHQPSTSLSNDVLASNDDSLYH